ncbi:2-dehydro-3-deoxyphosphogluconate aldolase [candidate division KSB1 bacterium]|nr:bifunctional 4-hydroxy-2-oxoglutarate aldolase/2-dehydro-3-deoxy-phosphogluconate aldolase [bacterium]RKY76881.1 MAG: 2-dehydro-3-deoxyphosphogluconate aldolase [candidate division KSB1 bacterium]HDI52109.1 bifunctional 4-hydroxy-2-oxoglutarate aldolase/2-dehydro-3-deoxy-phosphogluconate aldolase [Bacteroidota bacterium]
MRTRQEILQQIIDSGVIAVIRMNDATKLMKVVDAISAGGVKCLEVTMTTPGAIGAIEEVANRISSDFLIGAGTVLDTETARMAILAGAEFIVSPVLKLQVIHLCHRYDKVVIPGAFTPTEILTAWEAGADIVKVFPATALGPKYFRDVRGPLPQVRLTPTGGVTVENVGEFIQAGACCVAVGTALLDKKAIAEGHFEVLKEKAQQLVANVQQARQG